MIARVEMICFFAELFSLPEIDANQFWRLNHRERLHNLRAKKLARKAERKRVSSKD